MEQQKREIEILTQKCDAQYLELKRKYKKIDETRAKFKNEVDRYYATSEISSTLITAFWISIVFLLCIYVGSTVDKELDEALPGVSLGVVICGIATVVFKKKKSDIEAKCRSYCGRFLHGKGDEITSRDFMIAKDRANMQCDRIEISLKRYDKIKWTLDRVENDPASICKVTAEIQDFIPKFETKALHKAGIRGIMTLTPKSRIKIMESIYGDRGPAGKDNISVTKSLTTREDIKKWEELPRLDEVQVPCIKVVLFDYWTYLIPFNEQMEDIGEAFNLLCREIAYDVARKKLREWYSQKNAKNDIPSDIIPYFVKPSKEQKDKENTQEIRKMLELIDGLVYCQEQSHDQILTGVTSRITTNA